VCGTKTYDNGTLSCASMDALRYMMDPRNSITEDSVFQFKSLETADVGYNEIAKVVSGTFLNDEECINAIVEASQTYNVNGYYLVAKMLTEH
jgi:beta-N-acetylglucosaminidase